MPQFDIDKATRRTPYRVPEGSLASLEQRILAATVEAAAPIGDVKLTRAPRLWRWVASTAAAVVVAVAMGVGMHISLSPSEPTQSVDQAFANLSTADQQHLMDCYDNERMLEAYLY